MALRMPNCFFNKQGMSFGPSLPDYVRCRGDDSAHPLTKNVTNPKEGTQGRQQTTPFSLPPPYEVTRSLLERWKGELVMLNICRGCFSALLVMLNITL